LKKYCLILFCLTVLSGCSSSIKLGELKPGAERYNLFGDGGNRNFTFPGIYSDSLKLLWQNDTHGGYANNAVSLAGSFVFVGDLSGRVYCFDAETGKEKGYIKTKGSISTAITAHSNYIYFGVQYPNINNSSIIIYDITKGAEYKNIKVPGRICSEIVFYDDELIVATSEGMVYIYKHTGEQIWNYKIKESLCSTPVISGKYLLVSAESGNLYVLDYNKKELLYKKQVGGRSESNISVKDSIAYCADIQGNVTAFNFHSGKEIWAFNCECGRIKAQPVFSDSSIYIACLHGELFSVDLITGKMNWKAVTNGVLDASPIITGNMLIVPDQNKKIHFVDLKEGRIIKTFFIDGRIKLSPVICGNSIYIGFEKAQVAKYEFIK